MIIGQIKNRNLISIILFAIVTILSLISILSLNTKRFLKVTLIIAIVNIAFGVLHTRHSEMVGIVWIISSLLIKDLKYLYILLTSLISLS